MGTLELVEAQAAAWGLSLRPDRLSRLEAYVSLLSRYEEANVIGSRDMRQIFLEHVLDSLSCCLFGPLLSARSLVDVGSGGGLPGIPLKIVQPRLETALVEATAKKVSFLRSVVDELALEGTEVAHGRVEELARTEAHRGVYDAATARAVARLPVVAEYCVPLLRVGGSAISMKGRLEGDELSEGEKAARQLGAAVSDLIPVRRLPEIGEKERWLVILEKVRETPRKYPRNVGVPAKRPLGVV